MGKTLLAMEKRVNSHKSIQILWKIYNSCIVSYTHGSIKQQVVHTEVKGLIWSASEKKKRQKKQKKKAFLIG